MNLNIVLTAEQANLLTSYILMTTNYRKGEAEAWGKISEIRKDDGTPEFKNAKSNAKWWADLSGRLDEIRAVIEAAPITE